MVAARRTLRRQTESKRYGEAQMERKWRAEEYTRDRGPEAKRPGTVLDREDKEAGDGEAGDIEARDGDGQRSVTRLPSPGR